MHLLDYLIIITYFLFSTSIAVYFSKRASRSTEEFFLSGRNLPWYLAGLSMVATTFAADTPLAVTELVAKNGIAGNWIWWNFAFGGLLTVFFFAKLWRRAGIMTEVEFVELRYSGKPARFLRGFRALYLGIFMNIIIMGWINVAMESILVGMFGISQTQVMFYVFACMALVAIYSAISGLWGVVVTDSFQFLLAMGGTILLAVIVVNSSAIGGISGLQHKLPDFVFNFFPNVSNVQSAGGAFALTVAAFLAYVGVQWWASWYPGAEPGGGGYVAQRMMSAQNEKHSLFATLFFQIAHYCLRPWPWILVGLSTLVLYPHLGPDAKRMGYIYTMRDFLPVGVKGLLVAAFFAAYMSSTATQLNWGSSYVLNDFYRRFMKPGKSEKHYIKASRVLTILLMIASVIASIFIQSISGAWRFILETGAGVGLVLILRWFWWRINAWSEISALIAPFVILPFLRMYNVEFPITLYYLVAGSTITWLVVTYLTKPTDEKVLISFYRKVHPGGILWKNISDKLPDVKSDSGFFRMFMNWLFGVVLVYSFLFGIGKLLFGDYLSAVCYLSAGLVSVAIISKNLSGIEWN